MFLEVPRAGIQLSEYFKVYHCWKTKIHIGVIKSQKIIPGRKPPLSDMAATTAVLGDQLLWEQFPSRREIEENYH